MHAKGGQLSSGLQAGGSGECRPSSEQQLAFVMDSGRISRFSGSEAQPGDSTKTRLGSPELPFWALRGYAVLTKCCKRSA